MLAVVLGLAPILAAELSLRWFGTPPRPLEHDPIFDTAKVSPLFRPSDSHYQVDPARLEFFRPAQFRLQKPEQGRRVFVLGGSTVQGRPYETETAFSTWLEFRLQTADPEHRYEVINCGGVSYASYRLAILLHEVLRYQPDAIILYTGHNEYLEERSYQTMRPRRPLVDGIVQRSRLLQTLTRSIRQTPKQPLSSEVRTRLDEPAGMNLYVRDQEWRDSVVVHFENNLRRMVAACDEAKVPLLLCQPVGEVVDTAPFKVATTSLEPSGQESFDRHWATALDPDAQTSQRMRACLACLKLDPHHAGAHFVAGRLRLSEGRTTDARGHLIAARDHDVCPLRATTAIVETVQLVAAETETALVDLDAMFDQANLGGQPLPDGIPDPARFVDHIHPTIAMHQEIGAAVAEELYQLWQISPAPESQAAFQEAAQSHLSGLDETYYARGKQRLQGLLQWAAGRAGQLNLDEASVISSPPD